MGKEKRPFCFVIKILSPMDCLPLPGAIYIMVKHEKNGVVLLCHRRQQFLNQRTSGPVKAHLTPGPGTYFNAFIHVYSPRARADNPLGTNVDVNRKPLSLCPFVASFKTIPRCFFMFFHMYIAPGRGRQYIGDRISMTTERPFLFAHKLQVPKWSLQNLILYTFLMILYMYIAPGQGITTPWGQTFDVNRKPLSLCPFVASLKKEIWFYTHF